MHLAASLEAVIAPVGFSEFASSASSSSASSSSSSSTSAVSSSSSLSFSSSSSSTSSSSSSSLALRASTPARDLLRRILSLGDSDGEAKRSGDGDESQQHASRAGVHGHPARGGGALDAAAAVRTTLPAGAPAPPPHLRSDAAAEAEGDGAAAEQGASHAEGLPSVFSSPLQLFLAPGSGPWRRAGGGAGAGAPSRLVDRVAAALAATAEPFCCDLLVAPHWLRYDHRADPKRLPFSFSVDNPTFRSYGFFRRC
jgi:hypothetical protein